jgi:hypothetical protein
MTTGGECVGPGLEVCDGVCVDTQVDWEHCGKCFNLCDIQGGFDCVEGECEVVILPYGAPMPEPLWV